MFFNQKENIVALSRIKFFVQLFKTIKLNYNAFSIR
jgi:hypothetical protein